MMQGATAYYLSHLVHALKPGKTVLIHAAAGGAGLLLTQMAKLRGAKVFATVSTDAKAALTERAGADEIINYTEAQFDDEVIRRTDGAKVDVVYDGVGKSTFEQSLKCLKPRGLLALYGAASGPVPPFDLGRLAQMGSLYITRPVSDGLCPNARSVDVGHGPGVWHVSGQEVGIADRPAYALEDAAEAHRELDSRKSTGKLVLSVGD
jgi:NADPH2:quinone reductase